MITSSSRVKASVVAGGCLFDFVIGVLILFDFVIGVLISGLRSISDQHVGENRSPCLWRADCRSRWCWTFCQNTPRGRFPARDDGSGWPEPWQSAPRSP